MYYHKYKVIVYLQQMATETSINYNNHLQAIVVIWLYGDTESVLKVILQTLGNFSIFLFTVVAISILQTLGHFRIFLFTVVAIS